MKDSFETDFTYDLTLLKSSEQKWQNSGALRAVYSSIFRAVKTRLVDGSILELGAGIGNSRSVIPNVVTSDIEKTEYVDRQSSAYHVNRPDDAFSLGWNNIFAVDMLHHLRFPLRFLSSASDALEPGGRLILVEPAGTAFGSFFYNLFHSEPIVVNAILPPFEFEPNQCDNQFANMGMGTGMFAKQNSFLREYLSGRSIEILEIAYRDVLAYPLTGGYSGRQLAPSWLIRLLLDIEQRVPQVLMRQIGLRMVIVLKKLQNAPA